MSAAGAPTPGLDLIVLVKFSVDVGQLSVDPVTGGPDLDRAPWKIGDIDENAIEEAVLLKERHGGRAVGLTLQAGREIPRDLLLRALAMGLDAVYVVVDGGAGAHDPLWVAGRLAVAVCRLEEQEFGKPAELVLAGESSADGGHGQVGPRVAEALHRPSVTDLVRLDMESGTLKAERMLEDRIEIVECGTPAVVTVGMEINEPRLPTVLQIMGAGRKPIVPVRAADPGEPSRIEPASLTEIRRVFAPPSERRRCVIEGDTAASMVSFLMERLRRDGDLGR